MTDPVPPASPSTTERPPALWFPVTATLAVQALVAVGAVAVPVLAPVLEREIGLGPTTLGTYTALLYGASLLSALLAAVLVGRLGASLVSQLCCALVALGLFVAAGGVVAALFVCALLVGLANGPETPASMKLLDALVPPKRRSLMFSLKQAGRPIGNVVGSLAIPVLAAAFGWRGAILVLAALVAAVTLCLLPLRRYATAPAPAPPSSWLGNLWLPIKYALALPGMGGITFSNFFFSSSMTSINIFLVSFLVGELGYSLAAGGGFLALVHATGALGRVGFGAVADRWSRRGTLYVAGVALLLAPVLIGVSEAAWPIAAVIGLAVFIGVFCTAWGGVMLTEAWERARQDKSGAAFAGVMASGMAGAVVMPLLFGAAVSLFGDRVAFYALSASALLGMIGLSRRFDPPPPASAIL